MKDAYKKAVFAATAISIVAFLCFQFFPRQIIGIFGSGSEEYLHFAERYFCIFLFFTFLNGIQPVSSNFFTSIGAPKKGIFLYADETDYFPASAAADFSVSLRH